MAARPFDPDIFDPNIFDTGEPTILLTRRRALRGDYTGGEWTTANPWRFRRTDYR